MEDPNPAATADNAADATAQKTWVDPQVDEIAIVDHTHSGPRPFSPPEDPGYKPLS